MAIPVNSAAVLDEDELAELDVFILDAMLDEAALDLIELDEIELKDFTELELDEEIGHK